jgi:hypothetical protein
MKSPKHSSIGTATGPIRDRHKSRGAAKSISNSGSTTRTPSVSPAHHVIQLIDRSPDWTAPRAHIPANERLALVKQNSGESTSNNRRSRGLSDAAKQATAKRRLERGSKRDHDRRRGVYGIDLARDRVADPEIEQKRTEERSGQRRCSRNEHRADGNAGRHKHRGGIAGRYGEEEPKPSRDHVGQRQRRVDEQLPRHRGLEELHPQHCAITPSQP